VFLAVAVWGVAVAAFGLVPWLAVALLMLALAGAADVVSAVFRNSILQTTVPDRLRGRLSAIFIAVVVGGPRLGDAEAGVVAQVVGPQFSVVSGGLLCVAGAGIVARLVPELVRWNRREHGVTADEPDDPDAPEDAVAATGPA
jgi:MFS family permease